MKIIEDVAFIICMYQEYESVSTTINTIRDNYENAYIVVVHSKNDAFNHKIEYIYSMADELIILPNLLKKLNMIPNSFYYQNNEQDFGVGTCIAGCRNASAGFSSIKDKKFDYIVGLTGDTKITNINSIHEAATIMNLNNLALACAKAYGQYLNSNSSPSAYQIIADRYQSPKTTDFVNTLYIVNGNFFHETKCLTNIEITNPMSTEQCFGDEFLKYFTKDELLKKTFLLNYKTPTFCYGFNNGIKYHS